MPGCRVHVARPNCWGRIVREGVVFVLLLGAVGALVVVALGQGLLEGIRRWPARRV